MNRLRLQLGVERVVTVTPLDRRWPAHTCKLQLACPRECASVRDFLNFARIDWQRLRVRFHAFAEPRRGHRRVVVVVGQERRV